MTIDTSKHELVPKQTKLSDKEKDAVLNKYGIKVKDLPKISKNDPSIQKLGVKAGDIIKIERSSRTAGTTIYYRGVLED